jgi:hypothetical protein
VSDAATNQQKVRIYGGALLIGLFAAVTVLLISALYFLVKNAQAGAETRALLVECVIPPSERTPPVEVRNPDNDCYARSVNRQGQAIGQIGDLSILAAACGSAHPGDIPATRACVEKGLRR